MVNDLDSITVMQALQRVDEHYRVSLAMFYLEDFSYKEIAEALEIPVGTVMSRLARGKAQLRVILGEVAREADDKIVPFSAARTQTRGCS